MNVRFHLPRAVWGWVSMLVLVLSVWAELYETNATMQALLTFLVAGTFYLWGRRVRA